MNMTLFQMSACDLGLLPLILGTLIPFLLGLLLGWILWAKWRKKFEDLEVRYNSLRSDFNKLSAENEEWKSKHEEVSGHLRTAKNDVNRLGHEIEEHKQTITRKTKDFDDLNLSLKNVEAERSSLTTNLSALQGDMDQLRTAQAAAAAATESDWSAKYDKLSGDLSATKSKISDLESDKAKSEESANALRKELDEAKSAAAQSASGNQSELDRIQAENNGLKKELDDLRNEMAAQKAAAEEEKKSLQASIAAASIASVPAVAATPPKKDNLTKIEGIGPKTNELLNASGIYSFSQLANTDVSKIESILEAAGSRFQLLVPDTWPKQARMAADGQWAELEKYQDYLDGGKEPTTKLLSQEDLDKGAAVFGKKIKLDDLTLVEGIGPKIASLLVDDGINTWRKLSETDVSKIAAILEQNSLGFHEPRTWPKQAELAADGKWAELLKWQDELDGGK